MRKGMKTQHNATAQGIVTADVFIFYRQRPFFYFILYLFFCVLLVALLQHSPPPPPPLNKYEQKEKKKLTWTAILTEIYQWGRERGTNTLRLLLLLLLLLLQHLHLNIHEIGIQMVHAQRAGGKTRTGARSFSSRVYN